MQIPKIDVLVVLFCYGGNGGVATILPEIAVWLARLNRESVDDDRIGRLAVKRAGDIPLSMERNRMVKEAKDSGFDVIVMLDSDNVPDLYLGHRQEAKSFFWTSFDFLYERKMRGLPTVVAAPYCGPPPHPVNGGEENVYVFYAASDESCDRDPDKVGSIKFEAYSREHAAIMRGIQPIAAGPTGCIMYSTDAFDLMPVHGLSDEEILLAYKDGRMSLSEAKRRLRMESWFFYEFTDQWQTRKASTEDVTNTREIQFAGLEKHGEPVVFCNWDAWAGHFKPKCVGAPNPLRLEQVSNVFAEAVRNNISASENAVELDYPDDDLMGPEDRSMREEGEEVDEFDDAGVAAPKAPAPTILPVVCHEIKHLISKQKAERVVVLGDRSGEVVRAAKADVTYVHGLDAAVEIEGIRRVTGLGTDVTDVAWKISPAEADAILLVIDRIDDDSVSEAIRSWVNHLNRDGILYLVSKDVMMQDWIESYVELDGWETMLTDRGNLAWLRREKKDLDVAADV